MSERTIPAPHKDLVYSAKSGIMFRAEENKISFKTENELRFVDEVAANIAQLNAEIFWLRNMMHKNNIAEKG